MAKRKRNNTKVTEQDTSVIDEQSVDVENAEEVEAKDADVENAEVEDAEEVESKDADVEDASANAEEVESKDADVENAEVEDASANAEEVEAKDADVENAEVEDASADTEDTNTNDGIITGITAEQASVSAMLTGSDIEKLLKDPNISLEEKLKTISLKAVPEYKHMTAKLLGYAEVMGVGIVDSTLGVGKQFDLYNTLVSIVETKDYDVFKIKFDILNLVFLNYKDSAYNVYKLFRFSEKWTWSKTYLTTLQQLVTVIAALAPLATRKTNIKKINMKAALDIKTMSISNTAVNNIEKYYNA